MFQDSNPSISFFLFFFCIMHTSQINVNHFCWTRFGPKLLGNYKRCCTSIPAGFYSYCESDSTDSGRECSLEGLTRTCGVVCPMMWDGHGRWMGNSWKPYTIGESLGQATEFHCSTSKLHLNVSTL